MTDEATFTFGADSVDVPPGTYPATLAGMGVKQSDQYGDFRTWDFRLDSGTIVGGATSMNSGSKSKGGRWARALLGREPTKGLTVDLTGRPCLVVVGLDANDWPKVTDVLPPLASPTTPQPVAPPVPAAAPMTAPGRGSSPVLEPSPDDDDLPF